MVSPNPSFVIHRVRNDDTPGFEPRHTGTEISNGVHFNVIVSYLSSGFFSPEAEVSSFPISNFDLISLMK
jgi:hypothetical protein